ncbi:MAG: hypothetical protein V2B19_21975 [Pseudomonadota bacterium]
MSDSEFLPVWKKYPGVAGTMIKAKFPESGSRKDEFAGEAKKKPGTPGLFFYIGEI